MSMTKFANNRFAQTKDHHRESESAPEAAACDWGIEAGTNSRRGRQRVQSAHEYLIAGHGQVGPGFAFGERALVEELAFLRVRPKEVKHSPLVEGEDPVALRDQAPVLAEGLVAGPPLTAGLDLDGHHALAEVMIGNPTNDDGRGQVTLRLVGPGPRDREPALGLRNLEGDGLAAVGAGEQRVPMNHRREDVHPAKRLDRLRPEHPAIHGVHPRELLPRLHEELPLPARSTITGEEKALPHIPP